MNQCVDDELQGPLLKEIKNLNSKQLHVVGDRRSGEVEKKRILEKEIECIASECVTQCV